MSITTLKRKTDGKYHVSAQTGYVNKISSGRPAFSLNDSRRVGAQHGIESIQTRMKGTGYRGHGGNNGQFIINPIRSNYQNTYDPFGKPRRGKPVIRPECPVAQQMKPLDYETKYQQEDALRMKKDLCDPDSKNSGKCSGTNFPNHLRPKPGAVCHQVATYVKRKQMDYSQYLAQKKKPLPPEKSHYPPMVSRNSIWVTVPNFSYSDFIQRVSCK
jgi:hypothetical protein